MFFRDEEELEDHIRQTELYRAAAARQRTFYRSETGGEPETEPAPECHCPQHDPQTRVVSECTATPELESPSGKRHGERLCANGWCDYCVKRDLRNSESSIADLRAKLEAAER